MKNFPEYLASVLIFISCLLLSGCNRKSMSSKELRTYMQNEENGVKKVAKEKDGFRIEAYLVRPELIFKDRSKVFKPSFSDSLRYIMLSFSRNGREALSASGDVDQYAQLVNNLSFSAAQYCHLIVDRDTLELNNSSFFNTYGTGASNDLLLVFKSGRSVSDYKLTLSEIGFKSGATNFEFSKTDIDKYYNIQVIN